MENQISKTLPRIWLAAVFCFIVAGSTGTIYRFGLIGGLPVGWGLINIRHAHSHLMYFGWVTPALMTLIVARLPRLTGRKPAVEFKKALIATVVFALLAYVIFFLYGYQSADFGGQPVPLSVIAATLNVLTWYVFIYLYFRETWKVSRTRPLRFWDAAFIFMGLASVGAWGVAVVSRLGIDDPFWSFAMTHLFLDLFSEGWFVLAMLGLIYASFSEKLNGHYQERAAYWGEQLIVVGLPVIFLLALPVNLVPDGLRVLAAIGGLILTIGIALSVLALWPVIPPKLSGWRLPLGLLALKALIGLGMLLPQWALWAQQNSLRILYLHILLLGFVTLGLFVAARETWGWLAIPGHRLVIATVLILLLSIIPLTGLWPLDWRGAWTFRLAAWVSFWPVAVVTLIWIYQLNLVRRSLADPETAN